MEGYRKITAVVLFLILYVCARLGFFHLFYYEPENKFPTNVRPYHYSLNIRPHLMAEDGEKRFTFDGDAKIKISPTRVLNTITLHSKNLHYSLHEYWSADRPSIKMKLKPNSFNGKTDTVKYKLSTNLHPSKFYILHFIYNGLMDNDMAGFYRSSYIDENNITRWFGATQLQISHARRVFPSFDRPNFKATFSLTIMRHKSMKSFSNTRIISSTINGDYATDVFAKTPKMSTYIVAFIVCEFTERSNGKFGVLSRPEFYTQTEYSFNVGQAILEELENYLDFSYYKMGINKMHLVAIPGFVPRAMENWGLITFNEAVLFYEDHSTILRSKQYIAATITHELSHIWFGDLVTCQWWSYLWLNEGFGRYFQYFATAKVGDMILKFEYNISLALKQELLRQFF